MKVFVCGSVPVHVVTVDCALQTSLASVLEGPIMRRLDSEIGRVVYRLEKLCVPNHKLYSPPFSRHVDM